MIANHHPGARRQAPSFSRPRGGSSRRTSRTGRISAIAAACLLAACQGPAEIEPGAPEAWQAPGTRRMAQRLALLAEHARPEPHAFMNREQATRLERLATPADPGERTASGLRLARELLRAGRTADSIALLEDLRELAGGPSEDLPPGLPHALGSWLATAYLRLGEQQNCLEGHTVDSCLLPIRGAGVHRRQDGSRAAIVELTAGLREDPEDIEARWLLNIAAMTVGEYPQGVAEEWLIPPRSFASERDLGRYYDAAPVAGLDAVGLAGGSALEDFDGDGHLDLMVSSWGIDDPLRLFLADGAGGYLERTLEAGLSGLTGGLNLVHADYDNDGRPDVLVLRGAWLVRAGRQPNSLLRNLGAGAGGTVAFEDVTEAAGLLSFHPTQTAAWGDYDNDGWLDLYVGNESLPGRPHPCQLFRNNGPAGGSSSGTVTFTDVAEAAGVAAGGYVKGVVWGDVDNDGWLDLYVSRLLEPNLLFHNQGAAGTFREVAGPAGVEQPVNSFPTWFWDFDNDGWLDIFVSGYAGTYAGASAAPVAADVLGLAHAAETPRLYRNAGDGGVRFDDVTAEAGLDHVLLAMGANHGDLDNDGYPDAYLGTGAPSLRALVPNRMFLNDAGRRFLDVTTAGGFGHLQKGHAVSFGDLDHDGDQDVYAVIGGAYSGDVYPNVLFENPGHGNRWLTLRLEGTAANRSAIGARIRLEISEPGGPREIYATVGTGGSFGSSSLQQEIGLGSASVIDILEVSWPGSGTVQTFRGLAPDRVLRLREGDSEPVEVVSERFDLTAGDAAGEHH